MVEDDDEEDITVLEDVCFWLLTINSCSLTAGVAGQIATCGTASAAGAWACCCRGLAGCGGNCPDFAACLIAVPELRNRDLFTSLFNYRSYKDIHKRPKN